MHSPLVEPVLNGKDPTVKRYRIVASYIATNCWLPR
jgi:hypothetical protein